MGVLAPTRSDGARLQRLRHAAKPIALSALAAGLAWVIARDLVGHAAPFFAPVAAVIVVGLTVGQRATRALELVAGQALGILSADLLVARIGTGAAQIALVVALGMTVAVLVGPGALLAQQAAISGVLVAVLQPPGSGLSGARFVDALIGGGVALVLNAIVFPTNPLALMRERGRPLLSEFARTLDEIADGLETLDGAAADQALARARSLDELRAQLRQGRRGKRRGREPFAAAPFRPRGGCDTARRDRAAGPGRPERARPRPSRSPGGGPRRPIPAELVAAVRSLAGTVRELDLAANAPERVGEEQVDAARRRAGQCLPARRRVPVGHRADRPGAVAGPGPAGGGRPRRGSRPAIDRHGVTTFAQATSVASRELRSVPVGNAKPRVTRSSVGGPDHI